MQDLNDLYYFVQVVDHRGFAPAARALGLQKSKLSRRIALLEERLGVRLIQRSSRHFAVTEVGQDYYRHCTAMLVEAEAAQAAIDQVTVEPRGVVRMSCPTGLLYFQFAELIARFMAQYPKVEIHLESSNRRVDVVGEGIDIAIRVRRPPLQATDLVMRKLDERGQWLVASPDLLARHKLSAPVDLAAMPSLSMGPPQGEHRWQLQQAGGAKAEVIHHPRLVTDDMAVLRQAAIAGIGVVHLPALVVWEDFQAGRLRPALTDWRPRSEIVHAVFASRRGLLPSVRILLDFLADECARQRRAMES